MRTVFWSLASWWKWSPTSTAPVPQIAPPARVPPKISKRSAMKESLKKPTSANFFDPRDARASRGSSRRRAAATAAASTRSSGGVDAVRSSTAPGQPPLSLAGAGPAGANSLGASVEARATGRPPKSRAPMSPFAPATLSPYRAPPAALDGTGGGGGGASRSALGGSRRSLVTRQGSSTRVPALARTLDRTQSPTPATMSSRSDSRPMSPSTLPPPDTPQSVHRRRGGGGPQPSPLALPRLAVAGASSRSLRSVATPTERTSASDVSVAEAAATPSSPAPRALPGLGSTSLVATGDLTGGQAVAAELSSTLRSGLPEPVAPAIAAEDVMLQGTAKASTGGYYHPLVDPVSALHGRSPVPPQFKALEGRPVITRSYSTPDALGDLVQPPPDANGAAMTGNPLALLPQWRQDTALWARTGAAQQPHDHAFPVRSYEEHRRDLEAEGVVRATRLGELNLRSLLRDLRGLAGPLDLMCMHAALRVAKPPPAIVSHGEHGVAGEDLAQLFAKTPPGLLKVRRVAGWRWFSHG